MDIGPVHPAGQRAHKPTRHTLHVAASARWPRLCDRCPAPQLTLAPHLAAARCCWCRRRCYSWWLPCAARRGLVAWCAGCPETGPAGSSAAGAGSATACGAAGHPSACELLPTRWRGGRRWACQQCACMPVTGGCWETGTKYERGWHCSTAPSTTPSGRVLCCACGFRPEGSQAPPPKAHPDQQQENEMGAGPPHQG